jgi:ubiquinone/menaquinone biosynthesis C-methylase UbiE
MANLEISAGSVVLDFGCGPGHFTTLLAERVGNDGLVFAVDIHPLAISMVEKRAERRRYSNIRMVQSDCCTPLADNIVDYVVFFDVFHMLKNPQVVIDELHRVLKPQGVLYFSDHHMKEAAGIEAMTCSGRFTLEALRQLVSSFRKRS